MANPASESPRSWLQDLCNPTAQIGAPFSLEHGGKAYDAATQGHAMVLLEGATFERGGPKIPYEWLDPMPLKLGTTTAEKLQGWGEAVECYCDDCDPSGANDYRHGVRAPYKLGRLFGRMVDRWLVFRFLEHLSGEVIIRTAEPPESPIQFFGNGWMVVLMPCRDDSSWSGEDFGR